MKTGLRRLIQSQNLCMKQFNIVYVSPLKRALDTAIVVKAKANLIVLDHRLKERGYGEFEGSPYEQYRN